MSNRTLIVNGDPNWSFRELIWCHALDLYPRQHGVAFVEILGSSSKQRAADHDHTTVIGNFPEVFHNDVSALVDEISEEISELDASSDRYLSVAVILSRADFEFLSQTPGGAATDLSDEGRAAILALRAAIEKVDAFGGDEGHAAQVATRLWLSIVVRDMGYSNKDEMVAASAMKCLAGRHCTVRSVFLLSNGREQDSKPPDQHRHFVKMRLLIDVIASFSNNAVSEEVRTLERQGRNCLWVRRPSNVQSELEFSTSLRRTLLDSYKEARAAEVTDAELEEKFRAVTREIEATIDKLGTLTIGRKEARDRVQALSSEQERRDWDALDAPQVDTIDITSVVNNQLFASRLSIFASEARRRAFEDLSRTYEQAFASAEETFRRVVSDKIVADRESIFEERRRDVRHLLNRLRLPPSEKLVDEFREDLEGRFAGIEREVAKARSFSASPTEEERQKTISAREEGLNDLINAENQLLSKLGLVRVPAVMFAIFVVPVFFLLTGRIQGGTVSTFDWSLVASTFGPIIYVLGILVLLTIVVVIFQALRAARIRNLARDEFRTLLSIDYDRLAAREGGRYCRSYNRRLMADLQLVVNRLKPADAAPVISAADSMIKQIANIEEQIDRPLKLPEDHVGRYSATAKKGFVEHNRLSEKLSQFLVNIGKIEEQVLTVKLPDADRQLPLTTFASDREQRLEMDRPGHV